MEGTPETIYLQTGGGDDPEITFDQLGEVTWCVDPMERDDTKYIRADIAERELSAKTAEAQVGNQWSHLAIEMLRELRLDYAPGGLNDADGVHAIKRLRAEAERLREALKQAHDAMEAFTDPEGNMPADTGEFRELKAAMLSIRSLSGAPK